MTTTDKPPHNPFVTVVVETKSEITINCDMLKLDALNLITSIAKPSPGRFVMVDEETVVAVDEIILAKIVEAET